MTLTTQTNDDQELIPCPACPDGYVWTTNGQTAAKCKVCNGYAALKRNGEKLTEREYSRD